MWSIYMIRCGDRSLYTGISNNVPKRFSVHQSGGSKAAKYTRTRHPLKLVFTAEIGTKSAASRVEYRVKQLPKRTKEHLVAGQISLLDLSFMQTIDCTSGMN
ncbi:MAG: GIY-YIG nuclease family protein [Cyanobacteria bacterium J06631_6]